MTDSLNEKAVALDQLDAHLKALLRLKIREFIHLSPWFQNVEGMDCAPFSFGQALPLRSAYVRKEAPSGCPHRKNATMAVHRGGRGTRRLTGILR